MTREAYENAGGFREELGICREIGQNIVRLQDYMNTRPGRLVERESVDKLSDALECVRAEIVKTRNGEGA